MEINKISKFIANTVVILFGASWVIITKGHPVCDINTCLADEMCVDNNCVEACTIRQGLVVDNAVCSVYDHIPHWDCPKGYTGHPSHACRKPCIVDEDCADTDICAAGQCISACSTVQCPLGVPCRGVNHIRQCYPIIHRA